jgi:hypothetical protein
MQVPLTDLSHNVDLQHQYGIHNDEVFLREWNYSILVKVPMYNKYILEAK